MEDNEKKNKPKSFLETVREVDAAERKAKLDEEARIAAERAKREQEQRKAYEDKLRREKLELIKLKQGVISEEDIPKEEKEEKHYTIWQKIGNFFYHNKLYLLIGTCIASIVIFLVYDAVSREKPDITSMYIATDVNMEYYLSEATEKWADCIEDHNGDGKNIARMYYVPVGYADESVASLYYAQGDRTKLIAEFQSGDTIMIVGDKQSFAELGVLEGVFADAREIFPDDPYAEELGYRLAGTDFKELIGYPEMDDSQIYVCFRKPKKLMSTSEEHMTENYDKAVAFFTKFLETHRVEGRTLPETDEPEITEPDYLTEEEMN
ncbi:MAG: hypothetical protein ACI4KF_12050 [Huintestinicola sp.]